MKTVFAFILFLALYDAQALEIQVEKMTLSEGFNERWELTTQVDDKIVLDCQSFIQGLLFGPVGDNGIMLQEWECDELKTDMAKSLKKSKKHCLEVDLDRNVLDSQATCPTH